VSVSTLSLEWVPGRFAVCRLDPRADVPSWAAGAAGLVSITRTDRELSIVVPQQVVPAAVQHEGGWVAMRVVGVLDFSLVGVLSQLTTALANAAVPVFAISTHDTDVLLVRESDRGRAITALAEVANTTGLQAT
jgi:hypothetical protein